MIRNFLFSLFFFTGISLISFIFIPAIILPKKVVLFSYAFFGYFNPVSVIPFVKFLDKNINTTSSGKQASTLIANCSG